MTTYVQGECFSACTMIFLGGAKRVLHKQGRLGFHRISAPGLKDYELEPEIDVERRYMAMRGIPASFIDKVFSTSLSEVWMPSHETLLKSGYVSHITDGADFGTRPIEIAKLDELEKLLLENPFFAALKRFEPAFYKEFWNEARAKFVSGQSPVEKAELYQRYVYKIEARLLPITSNEAAIELAQARLDMLKFAGARSPVLCAKIINPVLMGVAVNNLHVPDGFYHARDKALAHVIRDAHQKPQPRPDAARVREMGPRLQKTLFKRIKQSDFLKILQINEKEAHEFGPRCRLLRLIYENLLSHPVEVAGVMHRFSRAAEAGMLANMKFQRPEESSLVARMRRARKGRRTNRSKIAKQTRDMPQAQPLQISSRRNRPIEAIPKKGAGNGIF